MKVLDRVQSIEKPESIQILSSNSYYYNYDIQPCEIVIHNLNNTEVKKNGWSYIPVYIIGIPSYNKCVKNVIRKYLTTDEEFDLINSYNKSIIQNQKSAVAADYIEYLQLLDDIKSKTKEVIK